MERTIRILVQTTTSGGPDDWSVERLSLLTSHLASLREEGTGFDVTARNRESGPNGDDPVLASLDRSHFDELWLFALDTGDGLTGADCEGITRFRQRGGGILSTRDHQDMGSSLCTLGGIGAAHYFHTRNPEPDAERHAPDDVETPSISWPNYHSGRNGDFQRIVPVAPTHELLRHRLRPALIELFPAHPHEGAVGVPSGEPSARVVAQGTSLTTGRPFNLVVAFERSRDSPRQPARARRRSLELSPLRRLQLGHWPRSAVVRDGARGAGHADGAAGTRGHQAVCAQSRILARSAGLTPTEIKRADSVVIEWQKEIDAALFRKRERSAR